MKEIGLPDFDRLRTEIEYGKEYPDAEPEETDMYEEENKRWHRLLKAFPI